MFELEDALGGTTFGTSVGTPIAWLTIGVAHQIEAIAAWPHGANVLARHAALGLVPFAEETPASLYFLDRQGVVHHDLDIEYFGPAAERWPIWLERWAWARRHFQGDLFVAFHARLGEAVARRLSLAPIEAVSDRYDAFWAAQGAVVREQRIDSRHSGTTLIASSLDTVVEAMLAAHEVQPELPVRVGFPVAPRANAVRGVSNLPLVLRARGQREGVYYRGSGELLVWGRPGHYRVELWVD